MDALHMMLLNTQLSFALYGLGTETERFIKESHIDANILGLLDSFCTDGELYGYPIISLDEAIQRGVDVILVVARPGSCKAIAKKIGDVCKKMNILLYDTRGNNLLEQAPISYEFQCVSWESKKELLQKIHQADVISFDLFDTLIARKLSSERDLFDLLDAELQEQGILIPDFSTLRLMVEKELSRGFAPKLEEIYDELLLRIGGSLVTAQELSNLEERVDGVTLIARRAVCDILHYAAGKGKRIVITTDSYYSENCIRKWCSNLGIVDYERILVSCEYGTSKTQKLFDVLLGHYKHQQILHIGNDEQADIESAKTRGLQTHRICSSMELFDALGGLGIDRYAEDLSDRIKIGLFSARLFNDPFSFEEKDHRVTISSSYDIGYLICAPIITDFVFWLRQKCAAFDIRQILFCARDGYLIGRLYQKIDKGCKSVYFLASRIAAIRAGMESLEDIAYVDDMKYSGSEEECLRVRFGVDMLEADAWKTAVLQRAKKLRTDYKKYIDKLCLRDQDIAVFDFVAKGTTQFYLRRLLPQHLKGLYFLRLEPEYMEDKHLDIESFFSDEEKETSVIYQYYYVLETVLTSPYPSVKEFCEGGVPVFEAETRNKEALDFVRDAQRGIEAYFADYMNLISDLEKVQNKKLDEAMLSLVDKLCILDEKFLSLVVEDPFFGRNTAVNDLIG